MKQTRPSMKQADDWLSFRDKRRLLLNVGIGCGVGTDSPVAFSPCKVRREKRHAQKAKKGTIPKRDNAPFSTSR